MKPNISAAATARVLARIDAATAWDRTAAAVDRILRTATAGLGDNRDTTAALCEALGVEPIIIEDCWDDDCAPFYEVDQATPGMTYVDGTEPIADLWRQQRLYAPEQVSPHLLPRWVVWIDDEITEQEE